MDQCDSDVVEINNAGDVLATTEGLTHRDVAMAVRHALMDFRSALAEAQRCGFRVLLNGEERRVRPLSTDRAKVQLDFHHLNIESLSLEIYKTFDF